MNSTLYTTFYSFKGGVGRSMLLVNVAVALALDLVEQDKQRRTSNRVLIWDLDLEAPGLHLLGNLTPNPKAVPSKGFLNWLAEWQATFKKNQAYSLPNEARIRALLDESVCPMGIMANQSGQAGLWRPVEGLSLLPAMRGEDLDLALYTQIDWHRLLVEEPEIAARLFLAILTEAAKQFDYILIDSRTGLTDLGGVLTALLPHVTVLVANYSRQNTHGICAIHRALERAVSGHHEIRHYLELPALELVTVASPVPPGVDSMLAERRAVWAEQFPGGSRAMEIPLLPEMLLQESLPVLTHGPDAQPYLKVAMRLNLLRQELLLEREKRENVNAVYPNKKAEGESSTLQGDRFEDRVAKVLTLLGYAVEGEQLVGPNRVDLIARRTTGFERVCYLVECKDHQKPIGKAVLETLQGWTQGAAGRALDCRGMVVANAFTPQARTYAKDQGMVATTIPEMENLLFHFDSYLLGLRQAFEQSPLARTYVEQRVWLESDPQPEGVDLLAYAVRWARGQAGQHLWLLLGDYGTGKTAFFKRLSYELAVRAEEDPTQPMPLAINLKLFPNATSLETLIQEYLRDHQKWVGNPEIFLYLLAQGRVVLLLDAFDEMGTAAIGRSVEDQFRQLARAATQGKGRVLITCRTHFFRDQEQIKTAFLEAGDTLFSQDSPLGQVARGFDAAMDELLLFNSDQIDLFLSRSLQGDSERIDKAREFIKKTYNLENLAPRPVMLEMILGSLDKLMENTQDKKMITPAQLYQVYTTDWLKYRSSNQLQTEVDQRRKLLEHLAWTLWSQPQNRIHHQALVEILKGLQKQEFPGLDLTRVDLELRTATFLTRTTEGYFSFSHKSFLEFFCARFLLRAMQQDKEGGGLAKALKMAFINREMGNFFGDMLGKSELEGFSSQIYAILDQGYQPQVSENGLRLGCRVVWHLAEQKWRWNAKVDMLHEMQSMIPPGVKLAGANLAGVELTGVWLKGADLVGADLSMSNLLFADLSDANLTGAVLESAALLDATAIGANFTQARMQGAGLRGSKFTQAKFVHAEMVGIDGRGADWEKADFTGANLAGARLSPVDYPATRFAGANLEGVIWERGRRRPV